MKELASPMHRQAVYSVGPTLWFSIHDIGTLLAPSMQDHPAKAPEM